MSNDMSEVIVSDSAAKRFNQRYTKSKNGCWIWVGHKTSTGYGYISNNGISTGAHRLSYMLFKGVIEKGLVIHHVCNTPSCVNPDHLVSTTQRQNIKASQGVTADNMRKTHCINGHKLYGENILIINRPDGIRRKCRVCDKLRKRRVRNEGKKN